CFRGRPMRRRQTARPSSTRPSPPCRRDRSAPSARGRPESGRPATAPPGRCRPEARSSPPGRCRTSPSSCSPATATSERRRPARSGPAGGGAGRGLAPRTDGAVLVSYSDIPGLELSGSLTVDVLALELGSPYSWRGKLTVSGPAAAHGTLELLGAKLAGTLGR